MANLYQEATRDLQGFGRTVAKDYGNATRGLQNVGRKIASNVSRGQKGLRNSNGGAAKNYYGAINPLKGVGNAFLGSFKRGGKIKRTGIAKLHKGERVLNKKQTKKYDKMKKKRAFSQGAFNRQSTKVFGK